MEEQVVKQFRDWGIQQYNKDGTFYKEKSISNYNSSLNTILKKLNLEEKYGFTSIYECRDVKLFERVYDDIFSHPQFMEFNVRFNHTHSAALNLYRRYVRYLEAIQVGPIEKVDVDNEMQNERKKAKVLSDSDLLIHIKGKNNILFKERKVVTKNYIRDQEIAEYAVRRTNGKCDLCNSSAPFNRKDGTPYLEAHHVEWLSRGGSDVINNVVALCPNCHRKIHILDQKEDTIELKRRLQGYYKTIFKEKY